MTNDFTTCLLLSNVLDPAVGLSEVLSDLRTLETCGNASPQWRDLAPRGSLERRVPGGSSGLRLLAFRKGAEETPAVQRALIGLVDPFE